MSAKIKHAFLVFFLAALVCRGASAQQPAAPTPPVLPEPIKPVQVRAQRRMMSTTIAVTVVAESDAACREHIGWVFARLKSLEKELNAFDPESDVARVNAKAATEPVAVSDDVFRAIKAGVEWHKRTRGTFDITVGPLMQLWRDAETRGSTPTPEELQKALALIGADRLILDAEKRTVAFPVEGMRIDLGGLGKGFCADEAVKVLRERRVRGALVAMSGDIYALGLREDGKPWLLGVQDPRSEEGIVGRVLLTDRAISTSGNYERFVTIQGKRYSHIKDPRTGLPADNVPSVSVIGPDTLTTDIMDTALSVLGVEEGMKLLKQMDGVEAMFITYPEGKAAYTRSEGFGEFEKE